MPISSRTPEGLPNHCPVCDAEVCIEPSAPQGDAPCPRCGALLWFSRQAGDTWFYEAEAVAPVRHALLALVAENLGVSREHLDDSTSFIEGLGADSLDIVELVMELEEEFKITIPDQEAEKLETVGEALNYVVRHLPPGWRPRRRKPQDG
jgi:acyl carrier protein